MATGRYVSDLDSGDLLGPVEYTLSAFAVREYCHAVELHQDYFQGVENQIAPPTLVHLEKLRLYRHACPAGTGPSARVQQITCADAAEGHPYRSFPWGE